MIKYLIFGLFIGAVTANTPFAIFPGQCRTVEELGGVHTNFNLQQYLGLWYEIERYEQPFQVNGECVTAQYTINSNPDGVRVMNTMRNLTSNSWQTDIGLATLAFPDVVPLRAQLTVRFPIDAPPPPNSNYWVLRTDYFSYAIVVSCFQIDPNTRFESYWFLSRNYPPTANARQRADEIIDRHLNRDFIRPTQQGIEDCFVEPRP